MKDLAFIDLETTGLDSEFYEIIEIGVIRVNPKNMRIIQELSLRVKPEYIERADPRALIVNGYSEDMWEYAQPLAKALDNIRHCITGTILAGHNVQFDKAFLEAAYRKTGIPREDFDYHVFDTATLAWPLYAKGLISSLQLDSLCKYFHIERKKPHRALDDAHISFRIAKCLLDYMMHWDKRNE